PINGPKYGMVLANSAKMPTATAYSSPANHSATAATVAMLQETGATSEDTEGLVSYVQALEGVKVALIFTEVSNGTKVSFRSKGDWHVNEWARALGGGGHRNASGAFLELPLREAIQKTLDKAPQFLPLSDGVGDGDTLSEADQKYLALMQGKH